MQETQSAADGEHSHELITFRVFVTRDVLGLSPGQTVGFPTR